MSLNKNDLDAFRRAKRMRALKIDFLIVIFALMAVILITRDHPAPRPGAAAFHVKQQSASPEPSRLDDPIVAKAPQ